MVPIHGLRRCRHMSGSPWNHVKHADRHCVMKNEDPQQTLMAKSATTNHESSGFDQHSVALFWRFVKRAHIAHGFGGETSQACKRLGLAESIRIDTVCDLSERVSKDSLHSGMLLQGSPSLPRNVGVRSEALSWERLERMTWNGSTSRMAVESLFFARIAIMRDAVLYPGLPLI